MKSEPRLKLQRELLGDKYIHVNGRSQSTSGTGFVRELEIEMSGYDLGGSPPEFIARRKLNFKLGPHKLAIIPALLSK